MKRVSFKTAKALKEAGYPQRVTWYFYEASGKSNTMYGILRPSGYDAPTYLEVWLWLWRDKKKCIDIFSTHNHNALVYINSELKSFNDPEEAIIMTIEQLVTNDLIK